MDRFPSRSACRRHKLVAVLFALVSLCTAFWVMAEDNGPVIPQGKGEQCVADTDFMRRNHMRLLVHQRDETVLKGIRDEPFRLTECVDCHVQTAVNGQPERIDADGQFCQSCHAYAAVKIDCFSCHAAVPDSSESAAIAPAGFDTYAEKSSTPLSVAISSYRHGNEYSRDD